MLYNNPYGYNNNYNNPYLQQQYSQPTMQQVTQPAHSNGGIQWVQGESGAKAYNVSPGQSVLLMDSENNTFYIKSTDTSGMPLPLRIFDYTERTAQGTAPKAAQAPQIDTSMFVTRVELEERLAALSQPAPAPQGSPKRPPAKKAEGDT